MMDLEEKTLKSAYEVQHFGFHSCTFFDKVYNEFYESLYQALSDLKKHLVEEYSQTVSAESIEVNSSTLFNQMVKRLDTAIDRIEMFLQVNIFKIPKHVVLPGDEVHVTHPCTAEEDENLDKELEDLKKKILEERTRKYFLKSKIAEQKSVKEELVMFENKLQQILAVVVQSRLTKEDLKVTMQKCWELSNQLKEPIKLE